MERREAIRIGVLGFVTGASAISQNGRKGNTMKEPQIQKKHSAAPCGLFCEACSEWTRNRCHGCGCNCGKCTASRHSPTCEIFKCVWERNAESCANCSELPCSELIMHTHDPIWVTHSPCIENLRRRKRIGTENWISEQREYWKNEDNVKKSEFMEFKSQKMIRELKQKGGYDKGW